VTIKSKQTHSLKSLDWGVAKLRIKHYCLRTEKSYVGWNAIFGIMASVTLKWRVRR